MFHANLTFQCAAEIELRRVAAQKRAAVHKALRAAERENDREKYLARVRFEVRFGGDSRFLCLRVFATD